MKTLLDVENFIKSLDTKDMLFHADDEVEDIPSFNHLSKDEKLKLQSDMDQAQEICESHGVVVFDYYPSLDH